jgi:hypothetical protein
MTETIQDAKAALEAAGLVVSETKMNSLQIGALIKNVGEGIHIFQDGCALNQRNAEWVALLPAEGLLQYEVPGTLAEGVSLILAVYQDFRKNRGMLKDACRRGLRNADQYLIGRSLSGV